MATIKALGDIPTLVQLYHSTAPLQAPPPSANAPLPSSAINARVGLTRGDITKLRLDAIVNAANTSLLGGGGVDGAIHRAAGPELLAECRGLGGCPTGQAKITRGYRLPARNVIHTVGPVYSHADPQRSERFLRSCYQESLEVAAKKGVKSLAFSCISTGVYGYPSKDAAQVACETVRKFLETDAGKIERVVFVTFEQKDVASYEAMIPKYFPPGREEEAEDK
ncbi:macro domain-containing protein [Hirsutella rhossiliensis]|uniref:Macro domain-containing protein n=1 Tax=Hirsutella rhossiliensis TaxID=111463 RepID=A0A9P8MVI9_9HYPO|nr:macro domain-containing protein [Hirsutella rhossiliensis]KAH0959952.1 macro domain-containing protein [Hirsutella rhossiliensis]